MGRNAGCHTYGNTFGSVYQQIGDFSRKYGGFFFCLIKVGDKIHHIFIQIGKKCFLGNFLKTGFRITHGRSTVTFDVAEVAVTVDQGLAFFEILSHDNQCIVNGTVTVGMIFTHGITHNTSTFSVRLIITNAQLMHIIEGSALYRLQAVSYIGKCTGDDNAHGIIDERLLHNLGIFCFYDSVIHVLICILP